MTTTTKDGAITIRLSDGRELFTRHRETSSHDVRQTPFGPIDFGHVILGPSEQWIRDPDGREYRGSHYAAAMDTVVPQRKPWYSRLLEWVKP